MTAEIFAFECGQLTMPLSIFFERADDGALRIPVPSFLVRHPRGTVLFDSGLNPRMLTDKEGYLGERLAAVTEVHYQPGEDIGQRLELIDLDIARVDYLVNSHLHFDHCGCNALACNSPVIVQQREWDWATRDEEEGGYVRSDYQTGQDIRTVDGEHDVFGDGSVRCIPTYGHTPGHQSLQVQTAGGAVVLAGDACYMRQTIEELALPGTVHDRDQTLASLYKLRELQARGAQIVYGHDPDFWPTLTKAPRPFA